MRGRRRAKLWLWHCLPLPSLPPSLGGERGRMAHGSGRDPGLCAPVIWEMRKMRRRRREKAREKAEEEGKATEWCSFQNKFPRVERGAEREGRVCKPTGFSLFSNNEEPQFQRSQSPKSSILSGITNFLGRRQTRRVYWTHDRAYFKLRI